MPNNYIFYVEETISLTQLSEVDIMINTYLAKLVAGQQYDALDFWRENEKTFPILAKLAKKYLSVPASTANVERMFSISGHIFSLKRRKLGSHIFSCLVFLKLNEKLLI